MGESSPGAHLKAMLPGISLLWGPTLGLLELLLLLCRVRLLQLLHLLLLLLLLLQAVHEQAKGLGER